MHIKSYFSYFIEFGLLKNKLVNYREVGHSAMVSTAPLEQQKQLVSELFYAETERALQSSASDFYSFVV